MDESTARLLEKLSKRADDLETLEHGSGFIDYSTTSTIVGWSSYVERRIYYYTIGKLVFVVYRIEGTSNSVSVSFTLPYSAKTSSRTDIPVRASDNGGSFVWGITGIVDDTVYIYPLASGGSWTNSGTKIIIGEFFYVAA